MPDVIARYGAAATTCASRQFFAPCLMGAMCTPGAKRDSVSMVAEKSTDDPAVSLTASVCSAIFLARKASIAVKA
jgi:hypothetical protein